MRAWLDAHPGQPVELSRDGAHWQAPEALLGRARTASRTGIAAPPLAASHRPAPSPKSPGWTTVAALSVAACLVTSALTLQRQGWADLSPWVPWSALGLEGLARSPAAPAAPPTAEAQFRRATAEARRAWQAGRLTEAALGFERALQLGEDPGVREDLARVYESIGATDRAASVRAGRRGERAED